MDERWLPMPDYEHAYEISDQGRVRCKATVIPRPGKKPRMLVDKILRYGTARHYLMVNVVGLDGKDHGVVVHRAVARAFVPGYASGLHVNHINGNPRDNRAVNLEWVTREQNIAHAHAHGLFKKGGQVGNATSVAAFDAHTHAYLTTWPTTVDAGEALGCCQATVSAGVSENRQRLVAGKRPRVTADAYVLVDSNVVDKVSAWLAHTLPVRRMCTHAASWTPSDVEQWRPVVGWETYYEVSDHGRVRRLARTTLDEHGHRHVYYARTLRPGKSNGYLMVTLYAGGRRQGMPVHRLVAQAFLDNSAGLADVHHVNGDKRDNRAVNLQWATHTANVQATPVNRPSGGAHHRAAAVMTVDGKRQWPTVTACALALRVSRSRVSRVCGDNVQRLAEGRQVRLLHGLALVHGL